MPLETFRRIERHIAVAACISGFAVAFLLSPKNYVLGNMAWYWGPHLAVLALVSMCKARSAVIAGIAFGMSIYLAAFGIWALTRAHPDSMVWLGYVLTLPGALAGAGVALYIQNREAELGPLATTMAALSCVLLAITFNQVVVCNTLMYCGGG